MNRSSSGFEQACAFVGRVLIALIFVRSGVGKIVNFSGTAGMMAGKGMPYAEHLLVGAIAIELVGGLALVLGYKVRWAAAALIVFLVPATLIFHSFWAVDPAQVQNQTNHFFKNVAILGALVILMGVGAGPASVNDRRRY